MGFFFFLLCLFLYALHILALKKVIVPAIYREFEDGRLPDWIGNDTQHVQMGYDVFMYQRLKSNESRYIRNRGTEGAVYLRYIVDHYETFPDVAIFVHAHPHDHQPHWLELVGCINENATYMDLNFGYMERTPSAWENLGIWMEQCWRDILQVAYNETFTQHYRRFPYHEPLRVKFPCCQQFLLSREVVHRRPLAAWKQLLKMMNEQDVCREGAPDYQHLYAYIHEKRTKVGPEPAEIPFYIINHRRFRGDQPHEGFGRYIQGLTMEHLSHVIFGGWNVTAEPPTMDEICQQFLPNTHPQCAHSPCIPNSSGHRRILLRSAKDHDHHKEHLHLP